jgi:hypothetical protein
MVRSIALGLMVLLMAGGVPSAQQAGERPTHIPTPQQPNSPFGTEWAKPGGTTGSYIYRDPRLPDPNSANRRHRGTSCPAPLLYDPTSGQCR